MKMRDMAENNSVASLSMDRKLYYPSFTVSDKQLPEAKNWKVGETYEVCIKVKMVALEEKRSRFEMQKIGVEKEK